MTQNLILILAFASVVWRFYQRKMSATEWCLMAFVGVNIFLVQLQMFVGERGNITWILRYHQAALVLLYGWTAWGVVALIDRLSGKWRFAVASPFLNFSIHSRTYGEFTSDLNVSILHRWGFASMRDT
jgi:hypothetical protein